MIDLNKKVFGRILAREIIGGEPPLHPETSGRLEEEYNFLVGELNNKSKNELEKILQEQKDKTKEMNGRPGSMAIAQDKIKLFTDFSYKYIQEVENKLKSFV